MNQKIIGEFITECRKNKKMTQQDLADKLGVTDRAVSHWENGRRLPDYSFLKPLCENLDISVNELLSGEKIMKENYVEKSEENLVNLRKQIDKRRKVLNIMTYVIAVILISAFILNMVLNRVLPDDRHWGIIRYVFLFGGLSMFIVSALLKLLTFEK